MGSGTGFWAALLRASGVDVSCFDVEPPSPEPAAGSGKNQSAAAQNEFHGDCPSFLRVQRGTPAALRDRRWRRHALLLCYPPPQVSPDPDPDPGPNPSPSPSPSFNPNPYLKQRLVDSELRSVETQQGAAAREAAIGRGAREGTDLAAEARYLVITPVARGPTSPRRHVT